MANGSTAEQKKPSVSVAERGVDETYQVWHEACVQIDWVDEGAGDASVSGK